MNQVCPDCGWPYTEVGKPPRVLDKNKFKYSEPHKGQGFDHNQYSSCNTCINFTGFTCSIHGPDVRVFPSSTCSYYIPGKPRAVLGEEYPFVTKEESALKHTPSLCKDCKHFEPGTSMCRLYEELNRMFPSTYQINVYVDEFGTCIQFILKDSEYL